MAQWTSRQKATSHTSEGRGNQGQVKVEPGSSRAVQEGQEAAACHRTHGSTPPTSCSCVSSSMGRLSWLMWYTSCRVGGSITCGGRQQRQDISARPAWPPPVGGRQPRPPQPALPKACPFYPALPMARPGPTCRVFLSSLTSPWRLRSSSRASSSAICSRLARSTAWAVACSGEAFVAWRSSSQRSSGQHQVVKAADGAWASWPGWTGQQWIAPASG